MSGGRVAPPGPSPLASDEAPRLLSTRRQTQRRSAARHLLYDVRTGSSSGSRDDDRKVSAIVSRLHLMPHKSACNWKERVNGSSKGVEVAGDAAGLFPAMSTDVARLIHKNSILPLPISV